MPRLRRTLTLVALAALLSASAGACERDADRSPGDGGIGFILVGDRDDLGYNQAIWEGKERVARAFPDRSVVAIENVPETDAAVAALESLIEGGASLLFATSFGHLDAAYDVARRHPDVVVVHQGGLEPDPPLDNFGTYFGTHSEAVYAAGVAAGAATKAGVVGFVAAFPIPATYNNVNALLLGARTMRPGAEARVVFTEDWCDPDAQRRAVAALLASGADVIGQHQDCTRTVLEAAEAGGVPVLGYHADGSEVAPASWLTGAIWIWNDLFVDIVAVAARGEFATSAYNGDFRGTLTEDNNPLALAEAGRRVDPATRARIAAVLDGLASGDRSVFEGPLVDTAGVERLAANEAATAAQIDAMDYFLQGVRIIEDAEQPSG